MVIAYFGQCGKVYCISNSAWRFLSNSAESCIYNCTWRFLSNSAECCVSNSAWMFLSNSAVCVSFLIVHAGLFLTAECYISNSARRLLLTVQSAVFLTVQRV
jgi:hypothetical protein